MNPRYIVHKEHFSNDVLYIKIEDGKYTVWGENGRLSLFNMKTNAEHLKAIKMTESFLKNGIWREVKVEELVLMI